MEALDCAPGVAPCVAACSDCSGEDAGGDWGAGDGKAGSGRALLWAGDGLGEEWRREEGMEEGDFWTMVSLLAELLLRRWKGVLPSVGCERWGQTSVCACVSAATCEMLRGRRKGLTVWKSLEVVAFFGVSHTPAAAARRRARPGHETTYVRSILPPMVTSSPSCRGNFSSSPTSSTWLTLVSAFLDRLRMERVVPPGEAEISAWCLEMLMSPICTSHFGPRPIMHRSLSCESTTPYSSTLDPPPADSPTSFWRREMGSSKGLPAGQGEGGEGGRSIPCFKALRNLFQTQKLFLNFQTYLEKRALFTTISQQL